MSEHGAAAGTSTEAVGDRARFATEAAPVGSGRSEFARDRARVLHCAALRRLAGKTQVLVAGEFDVPRTRLTHSLEVAQVARELGGALGCDPDVVEVAGLAHDLGHPPFGHNGEAALNDLMADAGGFEGNAQTFRILTRLEAKVSRRGRSVGLNLTRAALDACTKYPWTAGAGTTKYGVYEVDTEVFGWMRRGAPSRDRSMEAQVMDWSDDVAYSVHDVDDAIQLGHLEPHRLDARSERLDVADICRQHYICDSDESELLEALARLRRLPAWVRDYDGSMRAMAAVKQMTSDLIGRFAGAAERLTRQEYGAGPLDRYAGDLLVPRDTRLEVAMMKAVAMHYLMLRPGSEPEYIRQRQLVHDVFGQLLDSDGASLDDWLVPAFRSARSQSERCRVVADQVASLTDRSLMRWVTA